MVFVWSTYFPIWLGNLVRLRGQHIVCHADAIVTNSAVDGCVFFRDARKTG